MPDRSNVPAGPSLRSLRFALLQVAVLLVLFATGGILESRKLSALASPDIWRHLSVGRWILDHHNVPHNILFSQHDPLPWVDSSWLFDSLTAAAVKAFGLRGLPLLAVAFKFGIGISVFLLARGARRGFWSGAALSAIALYLLNALPFRSSMVSVMLFAVAMALITAARSARNQRALYLLPPLFLLWASLDLQFVYGLMALTLYLAAEAVAVLVRRSGTATPDPSRPRIPLGTIAMVTAASFAASLCTPYGYQLAGAALRSVSMFKADLYFAEMHSLRFRQPQDYVLLLLVMAAFFALGRRHGRDLFSLALLAVCAVISFHLQRDAWLVTLAAVASLAQTLDANSSDHPRIFDPSAPGWVLPTATMLALVALIPTFAVRVPARDDLLLATVSEKFPVRACDYIRQHDLPKPLFNTFDWGSFLSWYLPGFPVVIDDRTDAYGEQLTLDYFKLTTGQVPLEADPAFRRAGTILLESDSEMGKALTILPGYRRVYFDDQAMVLVRGS